jgi:hypothetical protein
VLTRKYFKKIIISITINGAISIPPKYVGINFLIFLYIGSVAFLKNLTIGLDGSGLTHDKTAEIITIHI